MVTLREILEHAGYDLSLKKDAEWLLTTQLEYMQLTELAEELLEDIREKELLELEQEADCL